VLAIEPAPQGYEYVLTYRETFLILFFEIAPDVSVYRKI
jgi:hypothetical protein